jgi:acetyl-CoA carboxylase biotin carboxyl carrier protein
MDLKLLQRLIRIMKRGELTELEVEDTEGGLRVRLSRAGEKTQAGPFVHVVQAPAGSGPAPSGFAGAGSGEGAAPAAAARPAGHTITSPMVGTFYRASAPDAEPFAQVGTRIKPDSRLCIIEAMKVMNEIKSEVAGEVLEVLVENGEPVEFGQPLFLVKLD